MQKKTKKVLQQSDEIIEADKIPNERKWLPEKERMYLSSEPYSLTLVCKLTDDNLQLVDKMGLLCFDLKL